MWGRVSSVPRFCPRSCPPCLRCLQSSRTPPPAALLWCAPTCPAEVTRGCPSTRMRSQRWGRCHGAHGCWTHLYGTALCALRQRRRLQTARSTTTGQVGLGQGRAASGCVQHACRGQALGCSIRRCGQAGCCCLATPHGAAACRHLDAAGRHARAWHAGLVQQHIFHRASGAAPGAAPRTVLLPSLPGRLQVGQQTGCDTLAELAVRHYSSQQLACRPAETAIHVRMRPWRHQCTHLTSPRATSGACTPYTSTQEQVYRDLWTTRIVHLVLTHLILAPRPAGITSWRMLGS